MLGSPVRHSLSPVLHRAAYAALGLVGWTYEAIEVDEAGLAGFVAGLAGPEASAGLAGQDDSWAGLSLTMPLKRAVRPLLTVESDLARAVGAVNTVTFEAGGLVGNNTDVYGMVTALRHAGVSSVRRAAVLGGGATAASAVAALRELGCARPSVHVRDSTRVVDLLAAAARLAADPVLAPLDVAAVIATCPGEGNLDVLVSTLPSGAADRMAESLARGLAAAGGRGAVLLDVVYDPWPTRLGREWAAHGGIVVSGFEMLLHQAAEQVRLMTGSPAPVEAMRAAGLAELDRRRVDRPGAGSR